jgi:hypothetical protein
VLILRCPQVDPSEVISTGASWRLFVPREGEESSDVEQNCKECLEPVESNLIVELLLGLLLPTSARETALHKT